MPLVIPILLLSAGVGVVIMLALASTERAVPVHEPDDVVEPQVARAKGYDSRWGVDPRSGKVKIYKLVDKILPQLTQASASSGVPLGVLVGWICKESGGKLGEVTRLDERGLFQIMAGESKTLGLDHQRLSTDLNYSINGGLALIGRYMGLANSLNVAPQGSEYFWRLVKLLHTMGSGAIKKIVEMAKVAGEVRTWQRLEDYALSHEKEIFKVVKHSPSKWFPLVDEVVRVGKPFGFGNSDMIVGGEVFADIVDPLDALERL